MSFRGDFPQPPPEPPDPPKSCLWCDGFTTVTVLSILTDKGIKNNLPDLEIACPRCNGWGDEPAPEPDPDRQRDEARERQYD